eukprot:TRINITY_DN9215_c0_g5_i1.p1 TRINITY_DN9215_c0_g5~~TRINITY_DN9215_c0_g5_i1.p1  ORF type:complete len:167 (+),score=39.80 TRINITY_DN9215_c0_g5_i1:75-575(+)
MCIRDRDYAPDIAEEKRVPKNETEVNKVESKEESSDKNLNAILELNREIEELSNNLSNSIPEFKAAKESARTKTEVEQFIIYAIKTYGSPHKPCTKLRQYLPILRTPSKSKYSSIEKPLCSEKSGRTFFKARALLREPEHEPVARKLNLKISPRLDAKAKLLQENS